MKKNFRLYYHLVIIQLFLGFALSYAQPSVNALQLGTPAANKLRVLAVDVGQGNCVLTQYPNGNFMLADAGSTSSSVDPAVIDTYITKMTGGKMISDIVLTHPDADHINMITQIAMAASPTNLHISADSTDYPDYIRAWIYQLRTNGTKVLEYEDNYYNINPDKDFSSGTADVYILAANVAGDANTGSIVMLIDTGLAGTALYTGDATNITENFIMKNFPPGMLEANLLFLGHHGSSHSSSQLWINTVKPSVVFCSASAQHMGYGHPRCEVINRIEKSVLENGKDGAVIQLHQVDCFDAALKKYVYEHNDIGFFLTATQGNMMFTGDGMDMEVYVDKL